MRGREFNQKKPETFNQLWTPEEQKRLEELLVIHPPEHIEMERFRKIAKALGNRTPLQVQSRVQKYFIKLQKAGLPVPGRTYNFTQYSSSRKVGSVQEFYVNECFLLTDYLIRAGTVITNGTTDFSFLLRHFLHPPRHQFL